MHQVFRGAAVSLVVALLGCGRATDSTNRVAEAAPQGETSPAGEIAPAALHDTARHVATHSGEQVDVAIELARAAARPGDRADLTVTLRVAPLWEIREFSTGTDETATRLELELPPELVAASDWSLPEPVRSMGLDGHGAYVGEVVFRRALLVAENAPSGTYEIRCRVGYQACDERRCLQPESITLGVQLQVE